MSGIRGEFNKPAYHSLFRKKVKINHPTVFQWEGPDRANCFINGEKISGETKEYMLQPGSTTLLFEVNTADRLPALIVKGEGLSGPEGWEVSLDGISWNLVETDPMFNKPSCFPDDKQELTVEITPREYFPLRNASMEDGKLVIGKKGYAVIDFWHLEVGTVKLNVLGTGRLSFRVGESMDEVLNENEKFFEQFPLPDIRLTGSIQEIVLPERALRYVLIASEESCEISSASFEAILWPVNFLMEFESSDPVLNNLWQAGIATLHTSTHAFYLDGIKRDYLPWSMDAIESAFAGDYLFGDEQLSRNGLSIALMPPNPKTTDLGIVDYPLHALVGFKHNYLRYGDIRTSLLYKDRIVQMLELYASIQDEHGFISSEPSTTGFIPGWATKQGPSGKGIASYGQIMLYYNYEIGAYFARLWKEPSLARRYEQKATALKKSIMAHFWDENQKAFINGYDQKGQKDMRISHHAQYWAILADLFPEKYYDHLFEEVLPHIPFYKEDISYEKGYEFMAYAKAGRAKDIFPFLDAVWGDWLEQGYTRFPENFSPQATRQEQLVFYWRPFGLSLCHGGNGVAPFVAVMHGILGFDQSDKKINEYYLHPELMHLDWVKGRIPVKEGFITYDLTREGGTIRIPEGCVVHIGRKQDKKPARTFRKEGTYLLN